MTQMTLLQPIRDEHRELVPEIEKLRLVANRVGAISPAELRWELEQVHEFLAHHLIPHARAEDEVLYPAVARAMGSEQATETMSRDHAEVVHLTEELAALREGLAMGREPKTLDFSIRRVLYGLHAILLLHFAKEEEIYLPLLERRLASGEADAIIQRMTSLEGVRQA